MMSKVQVYSLLTEFDISLFQSGKHFRLYEKMGAHIVENDGVKGMYFSVFAPAAKAVSVVGNFNNWNRQAHALFVRWDSSGIWEGFIPGVQQGEVYKYAITDTRGFTFEKADPFAFYCENPPRTASVTWESQYTWKDKKWLKTRVKSNALGQPFSVYEVHLGSWKRHQQGNTALSYVELATELVTYVKDMGYTHVEFMPIMEHPYEPSWGYQVTGFFAPTSRFGDPDEFKYLIDTFHQNGIAVILDWVPAHFPSDGHGLGYFDGSNVYEHPDRRKGYHPDWQTLIFNFERNEVRSFLISNAFFWLDQYHIDGLRVDAVASMIYLDYSRNDGEWEPNQYGGNEYLAAISLLKEMNEAVYSSFEGIMTIAEESTAFAGVSRPVHVGGLGFGMKWMMGWMHDTLNYFKRDTIYRKFHQNDITFSMVYAYSENFMLPLSHDEVVHGKASILGRMPGDEWQRFANLRLLYSYMYFHPGGKLLFMGNDIGQYIEWNFKQGLDWQLLKFLPHQGVNKLVKDLNKLYTKENALHTQDFVQDGFEWIAYDDHNNSVISFLRKGTRKKDLILVVCNFTPSTLSDYYLGIPKSKKWQLIHNSDDKGYYGSGFEIKEQLTVEKIAHHGREQSVNVTIPPLGCVGYRVV